MNAQESRLLRVAGVLVYRIALGLLALVKRRGVFLQPKRAWLEQKNDRIKYAKLQRIEGSNGGRLFGACSGLWANSCTVKVFVDSLCVLSCVCYSFVLYSGCLIFFSRNLMMKKFIAFLSLSLVVAPAFASKNCEELKAEIAAKLDAKGVQGYTLDIVTTEEVKDQKVVGSCEAGAKKITYKKA